MRKCDGFIFQTGYGRGIDNTTDVISRIKDWLAKDPERLDSVEDSRDIDDDSTEVLATEMVNKTDLEEVILKVNSLDLDTNRDAINATSAVLGSWFSTPKPTPIHTLFRMYGHGGWDNDNNAFSASIKEMDSDRNLHYHSKLDVSNDMDNIYGDQHEICAISGLGHNNEQELGVGPERSTADCFVIGTNKREFYSLSWEEIEEAAEKDELLVKLKSALQSSKEDELSELLKGKLIHCTKSKGGLSAIKMEDLSLYRNIIMVRDRMWAPPRHQVRIFQQPPLGSQISGHDATLSFKKRILDRNV